MARTLDSALFTGFHGIDCSEMFENQNEVGEAMSEFLAAETAQHHEHPVTRSNLFITNKLAQNSRLPKDVVSATERTIADLGCEYLDLLLIQSPFNPPCPLAETWRALESLVHAGKVRHIGVSNFRIADLEAIFEVATIKPVINQVRNCMT